jgi:uroporphyrinogen III methyltransferase/synthase
LTNSKNDPGSAVASELPLHSKTILVTRPKDQAEEFGQLLSEQGANVVFIPTIQIMSPESWQSCDTAIDHIDVYEAFIFTSANAVEAFFGRLHARANDSARKRFGNKVCYVVGSKTGEALLGEGIAPSALPGVANGRQLAEALLRSPIRGKRFLFPRGNLATEELVEILRSNGARVDEVTVYNTVTPTDADAQMIRATIKKDSIDVVSFFSPSSVKNFLALVPLALVSSKTIAAIGTSTATAIRELGLPVHILPLQPTSKDMVNAMVQYFRE